MSLEITPQVVSITGTANQVVASSPNGAVTLSTPQSIATSSSPTFANLTDSALTSGRVVVAGTSGILADDADLTFSGTRLTATDFTSTNLPTLAGANGVNISTAQTLTNKIVSATGTTIPAIIAPAHVTLGAGVTTVVHATPASTIVNVFNITITNPLVAGQIIIWANLGTVSPSVADTTFLFDLAFGTGPTVLLTNTDFYHTTLFRHVITLSGTAAVATGGTQTIRVRMQRDNGDTGTLTAEGGRCNVHWLIIPGAGTTA